MAYYIGRFGLFLLLITTLFALPACDSDDPEDPEEEFGAVYTMTNAADGNEVVAFRRADDGGLTRIGAVSAGGNGSGPPAVLPVDPLESQDPLILSDDNRFLFVVNAGNDTIASFRVQDDGSVVLVGAVASGGGFPTSLAVNGDLLYVLNAAGQGNISGFRVGTDGALTPLANSTRPLSGTPTPPPLNGFVAPGNVSFSPDGRHLVATEKATDLIDVYVVGSDGTPSAPNVQASAGPTPFGGEFSGSGVFIVSDANAANPLMPVPGGSSVSSYTLAADGTLTTASAAVPTLGTAACWIEVSDDDRYVYTTNTLSDTITGFRLGADGTLTALDPADGVTAQLAATSFPLDMAFAGEFMYALAAGGGVVNGFRVEEDGSLTALPGATVGGLPGPTVEGLAAF
jgi:6-phosphogluconolactonase (cycloisomerase 2 family)